MPLLSLTPVELLIARAEDLLIDSFLRESPLFGALASSVEMIKQKEVTWGEKVAQGTTSGRAITAPLSEDTQAILKGATMSIPDYYVKHQFKVLKQDMQIAQSNGRISEIRNPLKMAVEDALDLFTKKVNQVLYTGDGTINEASAGVYGLNSIVQQTGSYAGVSRSDFPRWRSLLYKGNTPGTPETLTIDKLTKVLGDRRKAGVSWRGNNPMRLLIVTTDEIERDVLRKIYSNETSESSEFDTERNRELIPYTTFSVRGIPVISDIDCQPNTAYLLNLSRLGIYGFDQSDQDYDDENIGYFGMRYYLPDSNPNSPEPIESTLWIRVARINDGHPDLFSFEFTTRFQLVAFDPIDSVTKIEDIANTI